MRYWYRKDFGVLEFSPCLEHSLGFCMRADRIHLSTVKRPGLPMVKRPCQRLHGHALGIGDMLSGQGV